MPKKKKKESSTKEETVTLTKEQFNTLLSELQTLKKRVEELSEVKAELEGVRELQSPQQSRGKPIYHTLSRIRELQMERELEYERKVQQKLDRAIDILLYNLQKVNPPKRY